MKSALLALGLLLSFATAQAREQLPSGCVIVMGQDFQPTMVCPK